MKPRIFPYIPRSSAGILPGDFWAVPLEDGSCAAGRVIALAPEGLPGSRRSFLGGLMDWHGNVPPSFESLSGRGLLDRGRMHILAITQTGGFILGNRPLELDGIEPELAISGGNVVSGFDFVRIARREDFVSMPGLSTWGFGVIQVVANRYFVRDGALSREAIWPYQTA